jgi:hypothetical protein
MAIAVLVHAISLLASDVEDRTAGLVDKAVQQAVRKELGKTAR